MKRVIWFRRDLRVYDNPVLSYEGEVLPIFIFDTNILNNLNSDDKRVNYIYNKVLKLKKDLKNIGLELKIFYGDPVEIFKILVKDGFDEVVASGDYDSYAKSRDKSISHILDFRYIQDTYIFRHDEVLKDDGTPYLVFTPFYKKALSIIGSKDISLKKIAKHTLNDTDYDRLYVVKNDDFKKVELSLKTIGFKTIDIDDTETLDEKLGKLKKKLPTYKKDRDYLCIDATSHLSVELRFGVIGVRQLLREVRGLDGADEFIRQLVFRDFYAYLLFYFPSLENENYRYRFKGIEDEDKFLAFINGRTGVPIVDAGISELLKTGHMHNRVRMIVASFFTKDLCLPWQWGESFFAKHLLDYDKASNVLSWQWSAGTGIDPQPYFRIFNPYLQSKKFDKEAKYIKKYLPQLIGVESKSLHDEQYLLKNDIKDYIKPMLIHSIASKETLELFKKTK